MSYYALNGLGLGDGLGCCGLGAIDFNAGSVWSDWLAGAAGNNAASLRAADSIRAALGQLGYGPVQVGVAWGTSQDKAAYSKFASDNGIAPPSGMPSWWPSQTGLAKLAELVAAGGTPGGGAVQEFHQTSSGAFITGAAPGTQPLTARAGMSTGMMLGLGALVIGGVALLAVAAKKKRTGMTKTA